MFLGLSLQKQGARQLIGGQSTAEEMSWLRKILRRNHYFLTAEYNPSKAWVVEFQDNLGKEWLVFNGTNEAISGTGIEMQTQRTVV